MMSLPDEKKWQLYCSQKNRAGIGDGSGAGPCGGPGGPGRGYDDPEIYVEAVRMFASGLLIHQPEEDKTNSRFGTLNKNNYNGLNATLLLTIRYNAWILYNNLKT